MYMYIYIYSQKLSPTFLWVSKFDVKLGSGGMIFKITIFTWFFKNHTKSKVFQKHLRQRAFFSKFDVKLGSWGMIFKITIFTWLFKNHAKSMGFQLVIWSHFNYYGRSFDQAPTLSLRGPAQFTHEARSAEFTDGIDGMGWMGLMGWDRRNIKSALQFSLYFVGI